MFKIIALFIIMLFAQFNVRDGILITCGNHLHNCIISLKREVWACKTSLTLPLFIKVPVPSQESEGSCICVLGVSILPLSTILIFNFRIVPTVWYFFYFILEWFRQCGIFLFYFRMVPTVWYIFFSELFRQCGNFFLN